MYVKILDFKEITWLTDKTNPKELIFFFLISIKDIHQGKKGMTSRLQ